MLQSSCRMIERVGRILSAAAMEFVADSAFRKSAALSYYSVFSLVPLLFLAVAVAGFVYGDAAAVKDAVDRAAEVAGEEVGDALETLLTTVQAQRGNTLSIGIALSLFAAASVFQQVQAVLGIVFRVPEEKRRKGAVGWIVRRLIGIASAIVLAVLVLTPVTAVVAMGWLVSLLPESATVTLQFGIPLVSIAALLLVTGLTFQVLTSVEIPWKAAMRGGAVTAIIGLLAAFLVGVYLSNTGTTGTLGALGGVAILLFFFNLMWAVYLFGAEVTKVYADYLRYGDIALPSELSQGPAPVTGERAPSEPNRRTDATKVFAVGALIGWLMGRRR